MSLPIDYETSLDDADQDADQHFAALLSSLFSPNTAEDA
jgi:hypothetical protein